MGTALESKKSVVYFVLVKEKQVVYQVEASAVEEIELLDEEIEYQGFHPTVVSTDHDNDN